MAGSRLDFGNVNAGDNLEFFIYDYTTNVNFFSNPGENKDEAQHVYSTAFAGTSVVPAGTYVGFEDTVVRYSDLNYADLEFVFTNTATNGVIPFTPVIPPSDPIVTPTAVPEPATMLLLSAGLAGVAAVRRRSA